MNDGGKKGAPVWAINSSPWYVSLHVKRRIIEIVEENKEMETQKLKMLILRETLISGKLFDRLLNNVCEAELVKIVNTSVKKVNYNAM